MTNDNTGSNLQATFSLGKRSRPGKEFTSAQASEVGGVASELRPKRQRLQEQGNEFELRLRELFADCLSDETKWAQWEACKNATGALPRYHSTNHSLNGLGWRFQFFAHLALKQVAADADSYQVDRLLQLVVTQVMLKAFHSQYDLL